LKAICRKRGNLLKGHDLKFNDSQKLSPNFVLGRKVAKNKGQEKRRVQRE